MADEHPVTLTSGSPDTVLPAVPPDVAAALAAADGEPPQARKAAFADVAARWPDCMQAWAGLAGATEDPVERYAYARTGYHRGLDALRAAGWRGSGLVRWRYPDNRGFLLSLWALGQAAGAIGETEEARRCATFLRQLDPQWTEPPGTQPSGTQAPGTQPPATQPPATQPPATQPPATQPSGGPR